VNTTEAQAAVMAQTADRFDEVSGVLEGTLQRLMSELDVLRTQWQGAGGRSFEEVRVAWSRDQEQLRAALTETAGAIRRSARQYDAVDSGAATRLAPVRANTLSLPL
jgi:WXG100 family type VII secretion target